MASSKKARIGLLPIGEIPEITSKAIAANILGYLYLDVDILHHVGPPSYALDKKRLQYDAGTILKAMEPEGIRDYDKLIGVVDVDIFVPILTHVFGEAQQGGRCALVSLFRLKRHLDGSDTPLSLLLERAAKVSIHELGHLFNLHHCMDAACLMHFSGGLEDLDKAPLYFCRYCSVYFRDALQQWTVSEP
ncbi:MAG: archaemetzincin family Zn-dependent metalloprotease [Pseudomonadota bacterium]